MERKKSKTKQKQKQKTKTKNKKQNKNKKKTPNLTKIGCIPDPVFLIINIFLNFIFWDGSVPESKKKHFFPLSNMYPVSITINTYQQILVPLQEEQMVSWIC